MHRAQCRISSRHGRPCPAAALLPNTLHTAAAPPPCKAGPSSPPTAALHTQQAARRAPPQQGPRLRPLASPCRALPLPLPCAPLPEVPLAALFLATCLPVIKVAMLCSVGAWCSLQGILSEEGRRVLSSLNFFIFTPCLFFSKLAGFGFSFSDPRLFPISLNMVLSHVIGALLGLGLVRAAGSPQHLHKHLILANAIGNIGNLPLVLVDSLSSGPGLALLGPSAQLGMQYVMLGNIAGSCIQFPVIGLALAGPSPGPGPEGGSGQQQAAAKWERLWQAVATPPLLAALLALAVGQMPAVRTALFLKESALSVVGDVVQMLGDMTIPALMLVLGANLAKGPGAAKVPAASIAAAAVGRLVLLPLIGTSLLWAWHATGLLSHMDPTALVVMMMMHAVPTALMVHSVATMFKNKEDEVAALLFWQYIACIVTLPAFMSLFLLVATKLCGT